MAQVMDMGVHHTPVVYWERPEPEGMWMQVSLPLWKHLAALGIYKVFCKGKIGKQCIVTCSFSPCSAHSIQGMSTV